MPKDILMHPIRSLIDKKVLKILEVFLKNKGKLYHLNKLSKDSGVPLASSFRIVSRLVALKIVSVAIVGKIKIYSVEDNKEIRKIEEVLLK